MEITSIAVTIPFNKVDRSDGQVDSKVGRENGLNNRRKQIMSEIRNNPNITTKELHSILSISVTAAAKNPAYLKQNGFIERVGSDRQKKRVLSNKPTNAFPYIPANIQSPNAAKIWRSGIFSLC